MRLYSELCAPDSRIRPTLVTINLLLRLCALLGDTATAQRVRQRRRPHVGVNAIGQMALHANALSHRERHRPDRNAGEGGGAGRAVRTQLMEVDLKALNLQPDAISLTCVVDANRYGCCPTCLTAWAWRALWLG